ncbi:MAG TPA: Imm50 family immunity protein [Steroidobacteraceae bacterium]|nr:Imm50 family immunity protein [Steroidobacteraceae bacterium]
MEAKGIESVVEQAETLTAFYGVWPDFHDAEVIKLHLWRGYVYPGDWDDRNVFPVLTAKILVLEATQPGATGTEKNVLVTLRFHDVDAIRLQDFNHNNSIVGVCVSEQPRGHFTTGEPLPPSLRVTFEQGFGLGASFGCSRIEVVNAEWAPAGSLGQPRP